MEITVENIEFCLQAMEVDFLKKRWERELYTLALMRAAEWGRSIDKQKEYYRRTNKLIDKYKI